MSRMKLHGKRNERTFRINEKNGKLLIESTVWTILLLCLYWHRIGLTGIACDCLLQSPNESKKNALTTFAKYAMVSIYVQVLTGTVHLCPKPAA